MKQELLRILRDVFRSAGYSANESSRYDLIAEKDGYKTIIKFGSDPDMSDIKLFADQALEGIGLYVSTTDVNLDVKHYGENLGLIIWDRDEVAVHIGRAVLADIEGTASELELVRTPSAYSNGYSCETSEPRSFSNVFRGAAMPARENATPSYHSTTPASPFAQVIAPTHTINSVNLELQAAPLKLTKDRASVMGKPHVQTVQAVILKLVPFWRYSYSLKVEKKYKSKIIDISGEGVGYLNALNGNISNIAINEVSDVLELPDNEYELKTQIITQTQAKDSILNMLIDEHTKDLRFDDTKGEAIISEHKRFKPAIEDINLQIDLIYVPIWEVKGPRNSVELNAHTAEVLTHPVDDDVEFI
ncbi:hypothetical protein [uncultured Methanomethylovorans sp.]|uniref:hypothetical protein n=1 Tax=uncultured Methanomethylovorans sp. TaxID=183759 RepID=UPI002AA71E09|nr:hypothetical protein [uncultured Methanomethylovorans sp.]